MNELKPNKNGIKPELDCISRQAAIDAFGLSEKTRKYGGDHSGYDTMMLYEIQEIMEGLPPVTPQPKMGKWEQTRYRSIDQTGESYDDGIGFRCSNCANVFKVTSLARYHFCPNCGSKMQEVDE